MKEQNDFRKTVEDQLNKMKDKAEKLRDKAENAKEQFSATAEEVFEKGEETWKDAKTLVKKHPVEAVGIALVIGAALGVLLSARRSRD